jgi:pimeloyl-ACP methyl ester carboxylesterase
VPVSKPKHTVARVVTVIVLLVTGLYLVCLIGLTLGQRKLIYYPCSTTFAEAEPEAAKIWFRPWLGTNGQPIGWVRSSTRGQATSAILLTHGNAGCAFGWFHFADGFQAVEPADFYILEYPGYGGRPGAPSEKSILAAADEAFNSIEQTCSVFLVGESIGTGPACYLAGKHNERIGGVFLVAPYNNLASAAQAHLPLFPVKWMLKDRYPSDEWLRNYRGPLAVLLAEKDTVVPSELGQKLYGGYEGRKKLWIEPSATHDDVNQPRAEIYREVVKFWETASDGK